MSIYFLSSPLWRRIIARMSSKRFAVGFTVGMIGGSIALGKIVEFATDGNLEGTEREIKEELDERDLEAQRIMKVSRDGLASLFAEMRGEPIEEGYEYVKLPEIGWHPKVQEQERKRLAAVQERINAKQKPES
eukprot:CAMPEP_0185845276 /NCGR_PEP_ID=MMETSP1354-20130828/1289_1 /TAXON_ID=708628 /ORGANISM="Erythrolobus madagascarensis, Strain CCMP3276" /LENGTH=132 /DNA_ID=CAMNT_0028545199 /DNA_START=28 /DNA_END=426 /DNA_ORIENTATION=+